MERYGQNVSIDYHWRDGQSRDVSALMADLARRRAAAVAVPGTTAVTIAAKAATSKIPIVFFIGDDPVKLGSFGRNRTGRTAGRGDHGHATADQVSHSVPAGIELALQPVLLDGPVALSVSPSVRTRYGMP
jgi:hypothetical protein